MLAANTCSLLLHASCWCWLFWCWWWWCCWTCGCWPSCECCRCSAAKWALDSAEEGWPAPPSSVPSLTRCQTRQGCCLLVTTEALVSIRLNWANSADPQRWKALGSVPWFLLSLSGDLALLLTFLLGPARRLFFCWRYLRLFRRYVSWLRRCRVLLWMLLAFLMVDLRTPHTVEWQPADMLTFKC